MRVMKKLRTIRYIVRRINNTRIKHYNIPKLCSETHIHFYHSRLGRNSNITCHRVNLDHSYYWE